MKKVTKLLTALVFGSLMIFISCSKKDDPVENDPADAIGTVLATISGSPAAVRLDGEPRDEWDATVFTVTYDPETNSGNISISGVPTNDGAADVWNGGGAYTLSDDGSTATLGSKMISISGKTLTFTVEDPSGKAAVFFGVWEFSF